MAPVFVWYFVIDSTVIGFLRCEALVEYVLRRVGAAGIFLSLSLSLFLIVEIDCVVARSGRWLV